MLPYLRLALALIAKWVYTVCIAEVDIMTGYQQAILYLCGSYSSDKDRRFVVCNVDRHYTDAVAELFPRTRPYYQRGANGKCDSWRIKSACVTKPSLDDVVDWQKFCAGFIEIQGTLDFVRRTNGSGKRVFSLRLRIYGSESDLYTIMPHLPAKRKKMQYITTHTGATCAIYYQSSREVRDILDYINISERNEELWKQWENTLNQQNKLAEC